MPLAQSPVDALLKHVQNPALYNFTTNGVSLPAQAHPLLKCAFPTRPCPCSSYFLAQAGAVAC